MDCPMHIVSGDGDLNWSDSNSIISDDELNQSPHWMELLDTNMVSNTTTTMTMTHTGQLSPVSNSTDGPARMVDASMSAPGSSTSPTITHSASSTHSWAMDDDDGEDMIGLGEGEYDHDIQWDQRSEDALMIPKTEPCDEDEIRLEDVKEAPLTPVASSNATPTQAKMKRPRGRPRKHPLTPNVAANKVTKGRSKTGCLTCRKRKKKCDEAKPRCMNCEKNAVVCEGYPEKQIWKSGKERAEEERLRRTLPKITIAPIFHGLETAEDMVFWKHYNERLSNVLTVEGEHKNAFKELIIPIAVRNTGLMHSILSLSSKHIDYDTPYGINLLKQNPEISLEALMERSHYHHEKSREGLYENMNKEGDDKDVRLALYGQLLCVLLESIAEGDAKGGHRLHLLAYRQLIQNSPPEDPAFRAFVTEFFEHHVFADALLRAPPLSHGNMNGNTNTVDAAKWLSPDGCPPVDPAHPLRLMGVGDGLFAIMAEITQLRNTIRARMLAMDEPLTDYQCLYRAADLGNTIRDWEPVWPSGDSREVVARLYQQMMWVYLFRTVYPPSPSSAGLTATASAAVSAPASSLNHLHSSHGHGQGHPVPVGAVPRQASPTHTPPHSTSPSCASSPRLGPQARNQPQHSAVSDTTIASSSMLAGHPSPRSNPPSRKNSGTDAPAMPSSSSSCCPVPHSPTHPHAHHNYSHSHTHSHPRTDFTSTSPPHPRPHPQPQLDQRITAAVEESLDLLSSLKPSDPGQTLLLMPCLVVGAACFAPTQRERIRAAVRAVKGYTGMRNADLVQRVLDEVWRLMDEGEWAAAWDWRGVAGGLEVDCLGC